MPSGVYKRTIEMRKKMNETRKGNPGGFAGLKHSQKTKDKMSQSAIERFKDFKEREKISKAMKGKGHKHLEETKRKIGEANRGKIRSEEFKERVSIVRKGKIILEATRIKMSESQKGRKHPKEQNLRQSKAMKKRWKNLEFQEKIVESKKMKPNNLEQFFDKLTPDSVRYTGDGQFYITTKKRTHNPDFKIKGQKKIIEIFGDYWHKGENLKKIIEEYAIVGWDCIIFWENEVYNDTKRILRETLEFISL